MRSILRTIVILVVSFFLAMFTNLAQGTMDERKLFVLWALYALALYGLRRLVRKGSTREDSG